MLGVSSPNKHLGVESSGWGALAATFWATAAFLVPQFWVGALLLWIGSLPLATNLRVFFEELLTRLLMLAIIFWVVRRVYHQSWQSLGYRALNFKQLALTVFLGYPAYVFMTSIAASLAGRLTKLNLQQPQDTGFVSPHGIELAVILILFVIITPIVEETIFRGFLFKAYRQRFGFTLGALLVSLLFAAVHAPINVQLDVFVFSLVLCYLREKTNNLWPCVILHMLKNLVAFMIVYNIIY